MLPIYPDHNEITKLFLNPVVAKNQSDPDTLEYYKNHIQQNQRQKKKQNH